MSRAGAQYNGKITLGINLWYPPLRLRSGRLFRGDPCSKAWQARVCLPAAEKL